MPKFGKQSKERLNSVHPHLINLFESVVRDFDCTILEGHRSQADQEQSFYIGKSKVHWPDSKHNAIPANAVDAAPWPLDWSDIRRFYLFAGFVLGKAKAMNIAVRWGGDWDYDTEIRDQNFNDLVHFELDER